MGIASKIVQFFFKLMAPAVEEAAKKDKNLNKAEKDVKDSLQRLDEAIEKRDQHESEMDEEDE